MRDRFEQDRQRRLPEVPERPHASAPLGRRYFVVTEAGRATSVRVDAPDASAARETFEVIDTTSNKFSMAAFTL